MAWAWVAHFGRLLSGVDGGGRGFSALGLSICVVVRVLSTSSAISAALSQPQCEIGEQRTAYVLTARENHALDCVDIEYKPKPHVRQLQLKQRN